MRRNHAVKHYETVAYVVSKQAMRGNLSSWHVQSGKVALYTQQTYVVVELGLGLGLAVLGVIKLLVIKLLI